MFQPRAKVKKGRLRVGILTFPFWLVTVADLPYLTGMFGPTR
jgi:hypothetical protein